MGSTEEHLAKARHNEAFVSSLAGSAFQDWRATGAFYAAVHYVDAFLATQGIHPLDHRARDSYVGLNQHLLPIYAPYRLLKRESEAARYRMMPFSEPQVAASTLPALARIKTHLRSVVPGV